MVKPYLVQAGKYIYVKVKSDGKPGDSIKIVPNAYVVEYGNHGQHKRVFFTLASARKFIKNNWRKL